MLPRRMIAVYSASYFFGSLAAYALTNTELVKAQHMFDAADLIGFEVAILIPALHSRLQDLAFIQACTVPLVVVRGGWLKEYPTVFRKNITVSGEKMITIRSKLLDVLAITKRPRRVAA